MKNRTFLQQLAAILILLGLVLFMTGIRMYSPYVYGVGALGYSLMRGFSHVTTKNVVARRLQHIQNVGFLFMNATTILLWIQLHGMGFLYHNEWMVALGIAAWIELYTTFRLDAIERQSKRN